MPGRRREWETTIAKGMTMRYRYQECRLKMPSSANGDQNYGTRFPIRNFACVLLVDDDAIVRAVITIMLKELGCQVLTAADGAEAVEVFGRNRDAVDLVLLDMRMPVMNGFDCFYRLKEINPEVRVIMASAFADDADIGKLKRDGMLGFLAKPYRCEELERLLHRFIPAAKNKPPQSPVSPQRWRSLISMPPPCASPGNSSGDTPGSSPGARYGRD